MAQIFHRSTNTISRVSIYGAVILVAVLGYALNVVNQTSYVTEVHNARPQPVPFSHKHHVGELGSGLPLLPQHGGSFFLGGNAPDANLHDLPFADLDQRRDARAGARQLPGFHSISWTRVNALPDFVYFNHSIHVAKGVGCTTCHGPVGEMNITWRENSLYMRWCLECHNAPEKYLRPRSEVFNAFYKPPADQEALGARLMADYKVQKLTNCTTCHR